MTSKEAFERIWDDININYIKIENPKDKVIIIDCLKCIEKDLEVLEIFKYLFESNSREYKKLKLGINCNGKKLYFKNKEDYEKVKEWLENEN